MSDPSCTTFDRCCARAGLVEWGRARPGEASVAVARGIRRTLNDDAGREDAAEVARAWCVGARVAPPASPNENSNPSAAPIALSARTPA